MGAHLGRRPVPRREQELVQAEAERLYHGNAEKVSTTSLNGLVIDGVGLASRYGSADELETMRDMVLALPKRLRRGISDIWCNSKACSFIVTVTHWEEAHAMQEGLAKAAERLCGGYADIELERDYPSAADFRTGRGDRTHRTCP